MGQGFLQKRWILGLGVFVLVGGGALWRLNSSSGVQKDPTVNGESVEEAEKGDGSGGLEPNGIEKDSLTTSAAAAGGDLPGAQSSDQARGEDRRSFLDTSLPVSEFAASLAPKMKLAMSSEKEASSLLAQFSRAMTDPNTPQGVLGVCLENAVALTQEYPNLSSQLEGMMKTLGVDQIGDPEDED